MLVWAARATAAGALVFAGACGSKSVAAMRGDGELVLELGGDHPSLASALQRVGVALLPQQTWRAPRTAGGGAPGTGQDGSAGEPTAPRRTPRPHDQGAPQPPVDPPVHERPPQGGAQQQEPPRDVPREGGQREEPAVESEWVVVRLEPRQTLGHVARRHLGSATRFKEIMEWNGWSDAQTRRLREGTEIRLLRSAIVK